MWARWSFCSPRTAILAILACLAKAPGARPADAATLADLLTAAGADDWTQGDARIWWESTFTPRTFADPSALPPTEFLEVGASHWGATAIRRSSVTSLPSSPRSAPRMSPASR